MESSDRKQRGLERFGLDDEMRRNFECEELGDGCDRKLVAGVSSRVGGLVRGVVLDVLEFCAIG